MTFHNQADPDQDAARRDHIENRWRQLHQMEVKWGDATLNYLFLVSGGSAAATLTYIGNLTKDGTTVPPAAFSMLACFASALLAVGLLKISITYQLWAIFRGWRNIIGRYYANQLGWNAVLAEDEANVKRGGWRTHVLGWISWILIAAGFIIGFINLKEESERVRTEKTKPASAETSTPAAVPTADGSKGWLVKGSGPHSGGGTKQSSPSPPKKEITQPAKETQ